MFDEVILKAVTEIANKRVNKRHPLLDKPIDEWMVSEILQATYDLMTLWEKKKANKKLGDSLAKEHDKRLGKGDYSWG